MFAQDPAELFLAPHGMIPAQCPGSALMRRLVFGLVVSILSGVRSPGVCGDLSVGEGVDEGLELIDARGRS